MLKRFVRLFLIVGMVLTLSFAFWGCGGGEDDAAIVGGDGDGDGDGGDVTPGLAAPVVTTGNTDANIDPGEIVTVALEGVDASTVISVTWAQSNSVAVTITPSADGLSAAVAFPDLTAYKNEIITILSTKRGHLDHEANTRAGVLVDRWQVQGYAPLDLEDAEAVTITATVETTSGTSVYTSTLMTHLPFQPATGLKNVPIGIPVLLQGKTQATYNWALTAPAGSAAALTDATNQNPYFTPDITGTYVVTVDDLGAAAVETLTIYAGTWQGAITGKDANGRPVSAFCVVCHDGTNAPDKFTDWKESGHAEIFTDNLDTSTYYGEGCFSCHSVGFNKDVSNNGFDDSIDYQSFLNAGLLGVPGDNWTTVLNSFPATAQKANIQCENCHGPNLTPVHDEPFSADHKGDDALVVDTDKARSRVSVASEVCGTCHGEPTRHARFQQWQESGHANLHLAMEEGTSTRGCANCHSGNGFVQWAAKGFGKDDSVIAPTAATVEPITCVACHDPHKQGTTSGEPNTATVRLTGTTPELKAGFVASGVGRGALCMVCHNSRRGAYNVSGNENNYGGTVDSPKTEMDDRSTHGGPQADILMGQNGFFSQPGDRGAHSRYIEDTCTTCHMVTTDPPAELSNNLAGTNHTFTASKEICSQCHITLTADTVQSTVHASLTQLSGLILSALKADIETIAATAGVDGVLLNYRNDAYSAIIDESGAVGTTTITSIAMQSGYPHGFDFTLADSTTASSAYKYIAVWQDTNGDGVVDAGEVATGNSNGQGLVDSALTLADSTVIPTNGQNIAKAKWNYDLVHSDGSEGVHNPSYVNKILDNAIVALTP